MNASSAAAVDSPSTPLTPGAPVRPNAIVVVLAFAGITAALMQTLVIPLIGELPQLLDTTASNASWVITATLLAAAVATPVSGRLADLFGKRRIMLVCGTLLVLGSVVCALAPSVDVDDRRPRHAGRRHGPDPGRHQRDA